MIKIDVESQGTCPKQIVSGDVPGLSPGQCKCRAQPLNHGTLLLFIQLYHCQTWNVYTVIPQAYAELHKFTFVLGEAPRPFLPPPTPTGRGRTVRGSLRSPVSF